MLSEASEGASDSLHRVLIPHDFNTNGMKSSQWISVPSHRSSVACPPKVRGACVCKRPRLSRVTLFRLFTASFVLFRHSFSRFCSSCACEALDVPNPSFNSRRPALERVSLGRTIRDCQQLVSLTTFQSISSSHEPVQSLWLDKLV